MKAIILGIVQGLTEFLPVSSSGHLAILQNLMQVDEDSILFFAAMLHFGTLISIIIVYFKDISILIKEFFMVILELVTGKGLNIHKNVHRKLGLMIITACIPTAIIGIGFSDFFESLYKSVASVGVGLMITGTLLWLSERISKGNKTIKSMKYGDALIVGLFQGAAIAPGISRSGATIVGSLFRGLNKELTVKFSFLISLPAVLGAGGIEFVKALDQGMNGTSYGVLFAGILASAISGYAAIRVMIQLVTSKKLHYFSYYTWALGIIIILLTMI